MAYSDVVLADNPVSYWRLGGSALDEQGVNNGVYAGSPAVVSGVIADDVSQAVQFDGTTAKRVDAGTGGALVGSHTVEAWYKAPNPLPSGILCGLIARVAASPYPQNYFLSLDYGNSGNSVVGTFQFGSSTDNFISVNSSTRVTAGGVYHVVGTYDQPTKTRQIYVNGLLEGVLTNTADPPVTALNLTLGIYNEGLYVYPLIGILDDAAIYDTRLSQARIRTHYMVGVAARETANTHASMRKVA